jgi:hypothetical protein
VSAGNQPATYRRPAALRMRFLRGRVSVTRHREKGRADRAGAWSVRWQS